MNENNAKENARYWADIWNRAIKENGEYGTIQAQFWDMLSSSSRFTRNRDPEREEERIKALLDLIGPFNLDLHGAEVLDIGAGMGSLAIPLAQRGAQVTAIDFSSEMIKKLQRRADEENVSITRIIHKSWDEIDLDSEGLRQKFDLVIASHTPAVRDPQTFDMMMNASKKVCYYSGWLDRRSDPAYYDVHKILFNKEYREGVHGMYLPLVYLYFRGYHPKITIQQNHWKNEATIDEIVDIMSGFFNVADKGNPEITDKIRDYFIQKEKDGKYNEEVVSVSAMMAWNMQEITD